ncbi:hypothetical protein ACFX5K_05365 [Rickettsiales bacterium LUAb2]
MKLILKTLTLGGVVCLFLVKASYSYVNVKVVSMNYNPIPFVQFNFASDNKSLWIANILNQTVSYDLQNSGMFAIYNENTKSSINYTTNLTTTNTLLSDYMDFNAIMIGRVYYSQGSYNIEFIVWDVYNNKVIVSGGYKLSNPTENDIYYTAHYIDDLIYQAFVGEKGYFNSKIAFVARSTVYMMDYDGRNVEPITDGKAEVYTPEFSEDHRYLSYITLKNGISEIYIYDIINKKHYKLGNFNSLVLAPRFSPDGKHMLFSIAKNGSTNIFQLNIATKKISQLTYSYSINIPGSYSPDGKNIVFSSDRTGNPQLYTMDSNGNNVMRISLQSKGAGYNTPRWSPRGDLISFTKILKGGHFFIGVMRPDGTGEKIIASDNYAEGPAWANNGRSLIYQFMYNVHDNSYAFYMLSLAKGYKLLIKPFDNVKDPTFSDNVINNKVLENKYSLY